MDNNENDTHPESLVSGKTEKAARESLGSLRNHIAPGTRAKRAPIDLSNLARRIAGGSLDEPAEAAPTPAPVLSKDAPTEEVVDQNVYGQDQGSVLDLAEYDEVETPGQSALPQDKAGDAVMNTADSTSSYERETRASSHAEDGAGTTPVISAPEGSTNVSDHAHEVYEKSDHNTAPAVEVGAYVPPETDASDVMARFGSETVMRRISDPMAYHRASSKAVEDGYAMPEYRDGELVFRMTPKAANLIRQSMQSQLDQKTNELRDIDRQMNSLQSLRSDTMQHLDGLKKYLDNLPR